jgi:hypothetical protein
MAVTILVEHDKACYKVNEANFNCYLHEKASQIHLDAMKVLVGVISLNS